MNESSTENNTQNNAQQSQTVVQFDWLKAKPNTAYFSVNGEFKQIIPANQPAYDPEQPSFLSLLIPSQNLPNRAGLSSMLAGEDVDNAVVEITTQVIDIRVAPLSVSMFPSASSVPFLG